MKITLSDYEGVAPAGTVEFIQRLAERVKGKSLLHVNSTRYGGGVAEILNRLIPLLKGLEIDVRWDVIEGSEFFFTVTKNFHNALQGQVVNVTEDMLQAYLECNQENAKKLDLVADVVVIHDPQPAALVSRRKRKDKWVWRCHIDISQPQRKIWRFLRPFVTQYDAAIFSLPKFAQRLPIPQYLVYPSIDPLSDKNRDLTEEDIDSVLNKLGIPRDKPILLQVSRYDRFKDPLGVIEAYKLTKKHSDCRLVLAGGSATDDPEGSAVLAEVQTAAGADPDIHVLVLPPTADLQINALQRAATIVLQKSTREGFGLTVSEAMWKGKPVIGGFAGGITVQIVFGVTGYTVHSIEGAAYWLRYLLENPEVAQELGANAKEYVRRNFLITRHLADYLAVMIKLL